MAKVSSRASRIAATGPAGRINPVTFLQETLSELRKSQWPSREETTRLTIVVIILSIVAAFFLGGLDRIFAETFTRYVL